MADRRVREIAAAMTASTACPLCLNWTDFIKTRMQGVQVPGSVVPPYNGGFRATAQRMLAEEGLLAVWGTALPASLLRESLAIGTRIGAYPLVRDAISLVNSGAAGGDSGVGSKFTAGVVLGAVSGLLASPCDLVRIRMQASAGSVDAHGILTTGLCAGQPQEFRSTFHAVFTLASQRGISAFFQGIGVNVVRSTCMTVGTVPVYEHTKHIAKSRFEFEDSPTLHFGAGIVTGLVGTTVTAPADVIRTRVMSAAEGMGIVGAASSVLRDHGPVGFFRGWTPAYIRIGPLFFFMPALIEQVRKHLFGLGFIE